MRVARCAYQRKARRSGFRKLSVKSLNLQDIDGVTSSCIAPYTFLQKVRTTEKKNKQTEMFIHICYPEKAIFDKIIFFFFKILYFKIININVISHDIISRVQIMRNVCVLCTPVRTCARNF